MRRPLSFDCVGATLLASLDEGASPTGVLIISGGRQTRTGPHRMMARLAGTLAEHGQAAFRFDRRGVGDSEGTDPGFRASGPDIAAALAAFRSAQPHLTRIWGLGLCDGATALALHGGGLGLAGMLLLNPWVVEAEANRPPPAAIRAHYRQRLTSLTEWRRLLRSGFNPPALVRGLSRALSRTDDHLAHTVMTKLAAFPGYRLVLLAESDATATAFLDQYRGKAGRSLRSQLDTSLHIRTTASHAFAGEGDHAWMMEQILAALARAD